MQRHYHSSATAGPNPLKINDDKVNSSFYNSFQFQRRCFVFRWSRYYHYYVHPSSSAKHTSSSLPLQPLLAHQIRTISYLVMKQLIFDKKICTQQSINRCIKYNNQLMRIRHPMTYIVHAACLHHLLATGIWRLGERARNLHHGRYIINKWINTISDHWAGR